MSEICSFFSRPAKQARKFTGKYASDHRRALVPNHVDTFGMMAKVIQVEAKASRVVSANYVAKLFNVAGLPISGETHNFAFVAIVWKPEKLCGGGISDAERVRILNL